MSKSGTILLVIVGFALMFIAVVSADIRHFEEQTAAIKNLEQKLDKAVAVVQVQNEALKGQYFPIVSKNESEPIARETLRVSLSRPGLVDVRYQTLHDQTTGVSTRMTLNLYDGKNESTYKVGHGVDDSD